MKLLIVIVNYRVTDLTIDCLHSVATEVAKVPGARVAVCENGTSDDAAQRIQKTIDDNGWANWCTLQPIKTNLGFTGGNNVILRTAMESRNPPEYFLLLNADTIVRPDAFKVLVDFMDQNVHVGIAGSRLEDPDGSPQRSAFRFQSPLTMLEWSLNLELASRILSRWAVAPPVVNVRFATDWVAGASMIIRRKVFEDVGLLDEGYYTYYDDVDFCLNAKRAGWPTWYVPESRVVHLVGKSTGVTNKPKRLPSYLFEARRRYFLKNHGPLYAAITDACLITGLALRRIGALFTGKNDSTAPNFLSDTIRHSVFVTGFKLKEVQNPALLPSTARTDVSPRVA
jgi:N-acetylglucosaminyl-diphospho-decaprenol L-rhamnosyltransferase